MSDQTIITIIDSETIETEPVLALYRSVDWSSANHPERLMAALRNCAERDSDALFTAWNNDQLVGLGNAISDGHLVVYYPHLVVHPDFQGKGVGKLIVDRMMEKYQDFHQHSLLSDKDAVGFYEKCGFERSSCPSMWIYRGKDH